MTTTSLIHHKPPPLKTRNDNPAVFLRSNNYYGSVGRPSHGRRKSAVELLQESKAFYVKSESVLDNKQEFKNAEHLHVRSPTMEMGHYRERGGPPPSAPPAVGGSFPYATFTCGTCPPYPHEHLDPNSLHLMHTNYLNSIKREKSQKSKVTAKITLIDATKSGENRDFRDYRDIRDFRDFRDLRDWSDWTFPINNKKSHNSNSNNKSSRRSVQPSGTLPFVGKEGSNKTSANTTIVGPSVTFTSFSQNGSLYSSLDKRDVATANLPVITSVTKNSNQGKTRERKEDPTEADSPPPLPPKSPRTASKPSRPHDFPQRLVQPTIIDAVATVPPSSMLPPPPPRRVHHESASNDHPPLRRTIHDPNSSNNDPNAGMIPPMTLPSPILPPTPPPDVVMESPMSDSGPIISPPPAFSTPVTPMLDRQNSSVSDRSAKVYGFGQGGGNVQIQKTPLSAAVSMSGVSSISSRSHKSIPDDVSMRYSPRSRLSSSSPMSHQDIESGAGSRRGSGVSVTMAQTQNSVSSEEDESEEAISADVDGDDDDSSRAAEEYIKLSRNNSRKSAVSSSGVSSSGGVVIRRSPNRMISTGISTATATPTVTTTAPVKSNVTITLTSTAKGNQVKSQLSKSITENFLNRVSHSQATDHSGSHYMDYNQAAQTLPMPHPTKPRIVSPVRRPILRSKSDLSHRYIKAGRSATLTPGFTLVHMDLGQPTGPPPPVPLHNSVSTSEFPPSGRTHFYDTTTSSPYQNPYHQGHHQHYQQPHIYSRPNISSAYENVLINGKNELDRFFDQLGLDNKSSAVPAPLPLARVSVISATTANNKDNGSESPVFFSSVSSVDSGARKSGSGDSEDSPIPPQAVGKVVGARTVGAPGYSPNNNGNGGNNNNNGPSIVVHHGEPSIVERNARVIKWLFNCRKASDSR